MSNFFKKVVTTLLVSGLGLVLMGEKASQLRAQSGSLKLSSTAFQPQATIRKKYSCDG